ncbi:MAG: hypothetical protein R2991_14870 [Thermoanaerobaculia bacterium]
MDRVRDFFDRSAESYQALEAGMSPYHRVTAAAIEEGLVGDVLSLGGLWADAGERRDGIRMVVADLSLSMLAMLPPGIGLRAVCDGRLPAFAEESFDHSVLPLILHHVTDRTFSSARAGATRVLEQVRSLARPGATLWISDFCTGFLVYALQRLCAPLTGRLLGLVGEPLVIMHSAAFYRQALAASGWTEISIQPIAAPDAKAWDLLRPVIAAPWLRLPRWAYPLQPTLIRATAG